MKIDSRELRNSYNSSRGINAGATIGYGHKIQTTGNGGSISASQSNQNTVETIYANGSFKNVNEVHNNTGSMVLNGFNQEGGKVTGNIGKVEVISRQNTSTTTGSSSGMSLGISANGVPSSVNINGSRTNGDRAFVDNQSTFIVGEGSNLHVGTLENTGAVIGKEGNSTFKIDSYIGKDIQNHDTMKTTGGSLGISTGKPRITNVGFNQDSRDKQGITRNTVVGDVEITRAEGSPINRDLGKANEVTKDTHSKTNINVESQTIEYLTNPAKLKEDIGKAKDEIEAVGAVAKAAFNTIDSKEKNGFLDFLRTERVQETVRNLGYIDTKGKTKEQIAQEMQDKYGEIFAKNGKKLEINFYVNSEVSQDDPNAKNKMNAAGFTAEDGSIWLNADNISSMNNFDLNSVFAHEGTHKVTGKNTELLADFGQSRAEKFINKSIDKGYLAKTGGGLSWEDGNLTEEQKQRLAEYTNEDIQFRMLTGDDRIDRRVNVNPNARRVNYQKQLNEVGRLERMYKKIDAKKAEEKRKHVNSVTNSLEHKYSGKFTKKNETYIFYNENDRKKFEKEANQKGVHLKTSYKNLYKNGNPENLQELKVYQGKMGKLPKNTEIILQDKNGKQRIYKSFDEFLNGTTEEKKLEERYIKLIHAKSQEYLSVNKQGDILKARKIQKEIKQLTQEMNNIYRTRSFGNSILDSRSLVENATNYKNGILTIKKESHLKEIENYSMAATMSVFESISSLQSYTSKADISQAQNFIKKSIESSSKNSGRSYTSNSSKSTTSKNPVTRMTATESRIAKQEATVLEEGSDGVFRVPENAVTSSKNVSKNLTNNTTEVINYTESVERIAQTAGNTAKNLKTPAIEYKAPSTPTVIEKVVTNVEEAGSKGKNVEIIKKIDGNTTITIEKHTSDIPPAYIIDDIAKSGMGRTSGNKSYLENYGGGKASNKVPPFANRENIHRNNSTQNYEYKSQNNGSSGSNSGGGGSKKSIEPPVKDNSKTYTLESQNTNWNFNSEIPKTAVKNSKGNYTSGRNNEWNFDTKYNIPYTETGNKGQGLVSVPSYNAVTNDYSRNYDVFYRSISEKHYDRLLKSGNLPPSGETSIAEDARYSERYAGINLEFKLKPGTDKQFEKIGVRNNDGDILTDRYPNMKESFPGWKKYGYIQFKQEGNQITRNLGDGKGLEIFNKNIKEINFRKEIIKNGEK